MANNIRNVYFVGGYSPRKDLVGAIAYLDDLKEMDTEHTRFYMFSISDNDWVHHEVEHAIVSVTYQRVKGKYAWHLLSKRGVVVTIESGSVSETEIKTAGTGKNRYGYVHQIREIAGELYICGMGRQVYKNLERSWVSIAQRILAPIDSVEYNFKSIDGTSSTDIYAVGWKGEIFHYDGKDWKQCSSPTNINLNAVKCVDPNTVYICGRNGILLKGSMDAWSVYAAEDFEEDLWGLDVFDGKPYIAYRNGIAMFDGNSIIPVDTKLKPEPDSGVLQSNGDELWSFGNNDLCYFNGESWERVICPDNT